MFSKSRLIDSFEKDSSTDSNTINKYIKEAKKLLEKLEKIKRVSKRKLIS